MFKIQRTLFHAFVLSSLFCLTACTTQPLEEPAGKSVVLTPEDMDAVSYAYDEVKTWDAWESKGNKLRSAGQYEEALYCYHQAMAAWPKKLADSAPEDLKKKHHSDPTDTFFQKGFLYLKMNRPQLALQYFKKFDADYPENSIVAQGMREAEAMLKQSH